MSPALPSVTARQLCKVLKAIGFTQVSVKGSHAKFAHPDGRMTIVPMHGGRDIPRGTLAAILRQADLTGEELLKRL